jgi:hypothetical protein
MWNQLNKSTRTGETKYDTVITETKKYVNIYKKDGKARDMNATKSDRRSSPAPS